MNAERAGHGDCASMTFVFCLSKCCFSLISVCLGTWLRGKLFDRAGYEDPGVGMNCLLHCCCSCCALSQEARGMHHMSAGLSPASLASMDR